MDFTNRPVTILVVLLLSAGLGGCGGKEARLAEHLEKGKSYLEQGDIAKARVEIKNVLQIDPKTAEGFYLAGLIEEKQGEMAKAYANYLKANELKPGDPDTLGRLARIYLLGGDLTKAGENADAVLAKKADDPMALTIKAAIAARNKNTQEATAIAQRVIEKSPGYLEAYALLAGIYRSSGQPDLALRTLEAGIKANPRDTSLRITLISQLAEDQKIDKAIEENRELVKLEPEKFEYRFGLARLMAGKKDLAGAEKVLRDAIAAAGKDEQRRVALFDFLVANGRKEDAVKELQSATNELPSAYGLRFRLANYFESTGDNAKTEEQLNTIIKQDKLGPSGLAARTALAGLRLGQERDDEAIALLAEVLKENPRDNAALLLRGKISQTRGNMVDAIADFRSILKDQPDSLEATTRLAQAHLANGEPQMAIETVSHLNDKRAENPEIGLLLAEVKVASGDRKAAMNDVADILKRDARNARALAIKADIEANDKNWDAAEKTLLVWKEAYPNDPQPDFRLGNLFLAQKKLSQAGGAFERALAKKPGAIEPLTGFVNVQIATGKPEKAIALIQQVMRDNPRNVIAQLLLARVLEKQGRKGEAESAFRKAVELEPKIPATHLELAAYFSRTGDLAAAETVLKAGISVLRDASQLEAQLGDLYVLRGVPDQAAQQFEAVLKVHPGNEQAANNLASVLLDTKSDRASHERALKLATRFKDSSNLAYLDTYGWAQVRLGHLDDAIPVLKKVIEKAPDVPIFQYHLGSALFAKGETGAAKSLLGKAVNSPGRFPGKEEAQAMLTRG